MLSPDLRAFAEAPDRYTRIGPDVERFADARVCIIQGPTWAGVSDVHVTGDEVEGLIEEVRGRVPAEKRAVWWLGPSTEPDDLHARLEALGFAEPDDRAPLLHALACTTPPPAVPGVEVRRVESFDEFVVATNVMWAGFGTPEERREQDRPHLRTMYEGMRASGVPATFLAYVDGEPVGIGRSVYSPRGVFLIAGSVVPEARGRGVYRALVRARWDDAVERGTPAMITEAMPDTSYPVLKRIGFVDVCTIRRLAPPT